MKNPIIISDKNKYSLILKSKIKKIIEKFSIVKSNLVIVIGGDGFMLQTLKTNKNKQSIFYGINSGSYGFLMNKFSEQALKNLSNAKK